VIPTLPRLCFRRVHELFSSQCCRPPIAFHISFSEALCLHMGNPPFSHEVMISPIRTDIFQIRQATGFMADALLLSRSDSSLCLLPTKCSYLIPPFISFVTSYQNPDERPPLFQMSPFHIYTPQPIRFFFTTDPRIIFFASVTFPPRRGMLLQWCFLARPRPSSVYVEIQSAHPLMC